MLRNLVRKHVRLSHFSESKRGLKLMEHAGMELLQTNSLKLAKFMVAETVQQAAQHYQTMSSQLGSNELMIKAQVLAGGRGKGTFDSGLKGGVHMVTSQEDAVRIAEGMLGHHLHTKQTGKSGQLCSRIMLAERKFPKQEYYFAIVLDRVSSSPLIISSAEGGMNIEELARDQPEKLHKLVVNLDKGLTLGEATDLAKKLNFGSKQLNDQAAQLMIQLYKVFMKYDCTLLEINPLAVDAKQEVLCMDCKMQVDDNARYRHEKLFADRDKSSEDPSDVRAEEAGINYIKLDGNIGCLVNGAGLAMATMDLIKLHGGNPANFLDVGGGADASQILDAFRIIHSDANVKVILVNIFGGILKCDIIAQGIVAAAKELGSAIPIVVRLQGTRMDEACRILSSSNVKVIPINDFDDAARKAVSMGH